MTYAAIVLAGGSGKRMGDPLKPTRKVGGISMLQRVLTALSKHAEPVIVVGPSELDDHLGGAGRVQEDPPGGGPVAALAAGFAACQGAGEIAVVAGDLPFLTAEALAPLSGNPGCTVYVDEAGQRQPMVAMWEAKALGAALKNSGPSMRSLLSRTSVTELPWQGGDPVPWYDCDTPEALREAERWL